MKFVGGAAVCMVAISAFLVVGRGSTSGHNPRAWKKRSAPPLTCTCGYPLVSFDMVRQQETNVAVPDAEHAPMGQMIKMRTYPAVDNHCCAAPNADTLYSITWLDVSKEPRVLSIPDMGDRYHIVFMLDGYSQVSMVASPATTGCKAHTYAITGPGWTGAGIAAYPFCAELRATLYDRYFHTSPQRRQFCSTDMFRVCSPANESSDRRPSPTDTGVNMVSSFVGSIPIGVIIDAILFGSALLAMGVARFLPEHHLSPETKGVVSVSVAVVGTLSALVVGLLISNSNASFTAKAQEVTQISADVISLDRMLRRYGPEAQDIRVLLRRYAAAERQNLFPTDPNQAADLENNTTIAVLEELQDKVLALTPTNATQRWLQPQALALIGTMMAARWQLGQQESASGIPLPLLLLVMFWFIIIFVSFGLFAPRNMTALAMIFLCSVGIGTAIRMMTELQAPFGGLIRIPSTPLTHALDVISR